jgi:hypothetical protein
VSYGAAHGIGGGVLTNDGDIVLVGLELPESDIDGDTTLTLGLELVKNPGVLEGTLTELGGFLYEGISNRSKWVS